MYVALVLAFIGCLWALLVVIRAPHGEPYHLIWPTAITGVAATIAVVQTIISNRKG